MLCYHRKLNRTWCHFGTADVFCTVHGAMRNSIDLGSSKSSRFSVLCCGVMSNSVGCRIQQATLLYFLYSCHIMLLLLNHFSCVQLFVTPWTVAHQAPLFIGFSRQEYWSGLPCPPPGDRPDPGIGPASLMSPALAGGFFTTSATWEVCHIMQVMGL